MSDHPVHLMVRQIYYNHLEFKLLISCGYSLFKLHSVVLPVVSSFLCSIIINHHPRRNFPTKVQRKTIRFKLKIPWIQVVLLYIFLLFSLHLIYFFPGGFQHTRWRLENLYKTTNPKSGGAVVRFDGHYCCTVRLQFSKFINYENLLLVWLAAG